MNRRPSNYKKANLPNLICNCLSYTELNYRLISMTPNAITTNPVTLLKVTGS